MTPDREQEIRTEVLAEVVGWLVKKAREHRAQGPQYAKQADVIGRLAHKVQRGAVRSNNLLTLPPQGGPEDVVDLRAEVDRLRARVAELEAQANCPSQMTVSSGTSRCALPVRHGGDHRNAEKNHHWSDEYDDAARVRPVEDPHDSPLHHSYALGLDLPEVTP